MTASLELNLAPDPLVLLPIRLETRFQTVGGKSQLWVLVCLDDVHVDSLERELTKDEEALGGAFVALDTASEDERLAGWRRLAERFGPRRAAWIATALRQGAKGTRTEVWKRAAEATVLPDRWLARGYGGGKVLFTREADHGIAKPYVQQIGPDPKVNPLADEKLAWLLDFEKAYEAGMGMKIELTGTAAIDALLVVGVNAAIDAAESKKRLRELLDAHHYSDGLAFVPEGTPTNNAPGTESGFSSSDPGHVDSFKVEVLDQLEGAGADAAGVFIEKLLALPSGFFSHVEHARAGEGMETVRASMNAALWPGTLGYYLRDLVDAPHDRQTIDAARAHFVDCVRAGGLPVLRVGAQPYGVLPAVAIDKLADPDLPTLPPFLAKLSQLWLESTPDVPQLGKPAGDDGKDLLAALSMQPRSLTYRTRDVFGPDYVGALWRFLQEPLDETWWASHASVLPDLAERLEISSSGRLGQAVLAEKPGAWDGGRPIVGDATYLASWFARTPPVGYRRLRDDRFGDVPGPEPLLYLMLRDSLLRAYVAAAERLTGRRAREQEVVEIDPAAYTDATWPLTPWDLLDQPHDGSTVGRHLDGAPLDYDVAPVRSAIARLASKDRQVLEQALAETLDLCSHRLDAWITSFATKRLLAIRVGNDRLRIGGYGWVHDLGAPRPGAQRKSAGYIHGPSPGHANAAAILASGYLAHAKRGDAETVAVDLSSDRVRRALWLLDGVRSGQSVGSLLGYAFERRLQAEKVPRWIQPFRQFAPPRPDAGGAVVDGLTLGRRWAVAKRDTGIFGTEVDGRRWPAVIQTHRRAVRDALNALDEATDALGDTLLAEGVYQVAQGNTARAAAALSALATGEALPAELDVVRTPRTGIPVTHRLLSLFRADTAAATGASIRARAEPRLDAWAGKLLGGLGEIVCAVEYIDPSTGKVLRTRTVSLGELEPKLAPLDVVYESADPGGSKPVEARIRYYVQANPQDFPADARVRLVPGRTAVKKATQLSLAEAIEVARALRELFANARAVTAADLSLPEHPAAVKLDTTELTTRATLVTKEAKAAADAFEDAKTLAAVRKALWRAAALGIPAAVPATAATDGAGLQELAAQAALAAAELDRRQAAASGDAAVVIEQLLGAPFRLVPRFKLTAPAAPGTVDAALTTSTLLQGDDPSAAQTWLGRLSRVRPGARRLADTLAYGQLLGRDQQRLEVGQVPRNTKRWSALTLTSDSPKRSSLSVVAHLPLGALKPTDPSRGYVLGGIAVDEFAEVIPSATETTAIAFHFDRPNATAPHAILIAVPPTDANWTLETIVATVRQTFDLARSRAVDRDALGQVGQYLPAIHFALNLRGATVSTDFQNGRGTRLK